MEYLSFLYDADFSATLSGTAFEEKIKMYLTKNFENAKKAGEKYNINPIAILSQGSIESGWGTSNIATNYNNYFGITAYGSVNDYWTGEKYIAKESGLPFRVYKNAADSFYDYARLISSKYKEAAKNSFNMERYAYSIAYSPYLSDKQGDNRPVYYKLIQSQAKTIETFIETNKALFNSVAKHPVRTGIFGILVLGLLGWGAYEYFFKDKENV